MLQVLSSRIALEHPRGSVTLDQVRYADGMEGEYLSIARPDYAVVAAVEDGRLWMVEQWRHPLRRRSLELPMGVAPGGAATPIEQAARIELREETGLTAARMTLVGRLAPAPGVLAQHGVLFLAEDLTPGPSALEPTEQDLVALALPVGEVMDAARSGRIVDGTTLASLLLLRLSGCV